MPPEVAFAIWLILLLGLLYCDPARDPKESIAVYVPTIWIFFLGSRLPSQWLGGQLQTSANVLAEGSPIDRVILSTLILLAILILSARPIQWGRLLKRNAWLVAFVAFALVSVCWSDFPLVSLKRWFRDLGNYLMILVILSDSNPFEAVRMVLRRTAYLLIPLSILLFKYFPELGMQYNLWTGARMFVGATTSKNMLGAVCLLSGSYFFWDTRVRWANRKGAKTKRVLAVNLLFLLMTLWVLILSDSATSRVCLAMACLVIVLVHSKWGQYHPGFLKTLVPLAFCVYLLLAFGFDLNGELASQVGRDPTLTERTVIWHAVLALHTNPLVGTGYEAFWLGPRFEWIATHFAPINESHNGYLEVYLNLGLIGVFLVVGLLLSSYRKIWRRPEPLTSMASLHLSIWTVALFYNMSEAAFKGGLLWVVLLLGAMDFRKVSEQRVQIASAVGKLATTGVPAGSLERPRLRET